MAVHALFGRGIQDHPGILPRHGECVDGPAVKASVEQGTVVGNDVKCFQTVKAMLFGDGNGALDRTPGGKREIMPGTGKGPHCLQVCFRDLFICR